MASDEGFVRFLCEQIEGAGSVRYKKMFGEYLIYCNEKPALLVCDDTAFVKIVSSPELDALLADAQKGFPYAGAKEHYVIENTDDREFMTRLARAVERVAPLPKAKRK